VTAVLEERLERLEQTVKPLEVRVKRLEDWAGPGQNEMLSANLADLRGQFDRFAKVQSKHTRILETLTTDVAGLTARVGALETDVAELRTDVAGLKTDVAELKADMRDVKGTLSEILLRLPPRPE
jgi:chromosome segregation ATPase